MISLAACFVKMPVLEANSSDRICFGASAFICLQRGSARSRRLSGPLNSLSVSSLPAQRRLADSCSLLMAESTLRAPFPVERCCMRHRIQPFSVLCTRIGSCPFSCLPSSTLAAVLSFIGNLLPLMRSAREIGADSRFSEWVRVR